MNTIWHIFWTWAIFRKKDYAIKPILFAFIPDIPWLLGLLFSLATNGINWEAFLQGYYYLPIIYATFFFHSFFIVTLFLIIAMIAKKTSHYPFFFGWYFHIFLDYGTHVSDAYPLFWPLSNFYIPSLVSYWESQFFSKELAIFNLILAAVFIGYLTVKRHEKFNRVDKIVVSSILAVMIANLAFFSLFRLHSFFLILNSIAIILVVLLLIRINSHMKSDKKYGILAIFAKYPEIGKVKMRLGKDIGNKNAMILYKALLQDTIWNVSKSKNYDIALCYTPRNKKNNLKKLFGINIMHPQSSGNLGKKMSDCSKYFLKKYNKIVIIGSDIPEMNSSLIKKAFASLKNNDVLLGESVDGGYYLIGMKKTYDIFSGIKWSTPNVLKQTIKKIKKRKLSYEILPKMVDIDTAIDLMKLRKSRILSKSSNTYKVLKNIKLIKIGNTLFGDNKKIN